LSWSLAIFAALMFGATPTLATTPAADSMRSFNPAANDSASPHPTAVASRYASSILTSRTVPAASWSIDFTSAATDS